MCQLKVNNCLLKSFHTSIVFLPFTWWWWWWFIFLTAAAFISITFATRCWVDTDLRASLRIMTEAVVTG